MSSFKPNYMCKAVLNENAGYSGRCAQRQGFLFLRGKIPYYSLTILFNHCCPVKKINKA